MARTLIIAEAGVNHNGSLARAREMVTAAARAGANYVKFQIFRTAALVTRTAAKADYQTRAGGVGPTQYDMLQALELAPDDFRALQAACREAGIGFLASPFDEESLAFLVRELQVDLLKLGSGELTNPLLLLAAARSGRPVILSTGMATLGEIEEALGVLAFGLSEMDPAHGRAALSPAAFQAAWLDRAARQRVAERVRLLHCTTEYPARFSDANLRAMATLRAAFGLEVGFSDHTPGIALPLAAVALGATIIEKHFTLDRNLPGPDHRASLEPAELRAMVEGIRAVEAGLGDPTRPLAPAEMRNRAAARKSLVALRPIAAGEVFTPDNLGIKRPGTGLSPMRYFALLGRPARRAYAADELVEDA
ncbi:MAG: N-acetylneuraminate synthase [Candidatus Ozemobacter sibiricus]|jgi:N-acetylneuraminate synthase|uniref:N-acetylneuraminate synthase n=1 Tax=Candidatus Ozemobacter sibiricus TaxID=2268124 RepID=A0A367ZNS7_9BACT|nr:MAG: N-acetylneuraminate synthase [Candidatus Ozemobacter sibiricus]